MRSESPSMLPGPTINLQRECNRSVPPPVTDGPGIVELSEVARPAHPLDPTIPFNRSSLRGRELEYIFQTITIGQIAGDQTFSKKCHALLRHVLGVPHALVTTSCTHALELAGLLLGIQPGDEVIVPSFTFVSTVGAFTVRGAKPVFCDVRPDTLNLDERQLTDLISPRTRAIVPVHYAGIACAMQSILDLASRWGIAVVEDNAHGLFGKYRGRWLGSLGTLSALSFHETKNITCGEGGALLINDARYVERAEILREKGTNRTKFFRGEVDRYSWVDIGSSYVMSDVLAAFLFGQLEVWREIQRRRERIWQTYHQRLATWCRTSGVRQPHVPPDCEPAWHLYYLIMSTPDARTRFITHLRQRGIHAVFHYLPLHSSEMGVRLGGRVGDCPVAEDVSHRLVRLPFYNSFSESEQERVLDAVMSFAP